MDANTSQAATGVGPEALAPPPFARRSGGMAAGLALFFSSDPGREPPGPVGRKVVPNVSQHVTLTDGTFDEEIKSSSEPVLVDFWAEWCGPCKMVSPILDEIASENTGKLRLGKINIDENLELARRFDVMSIPTMILFKDGEPKLRIVGAKGKGQLLNELHPFL
jgi:thioredoxin